MTNEEAIKRLKEVQAEFNENWVDYGGINEAFEKAYQALEERPQGEWIPQGDEFSWVFKCSCCGWVDGYPFNERHKYCPNCGADMRGGKEE